MSPFTLLYPPLIRFGWGVRGELPEILASVGLGPGKRTVLVCTGALACHGMRDEMQALCGGGNTVCYDRVPHDPPLSTVDAIVDLVREFGAAGIVAVGGGSVIDAAKAAAAVFPAGGRTQVYFDEREPLTGESLPFVALPTTAGTGTEVTKNSVLTDPVAGAKKSLRHTCMVPRAAMVDPELTVSLPRHITAASGLDALTQAVESYISTSANAVSRPLAAAATGLLLKALPAACRNGLDRAARTAVAQGSLLSGMAFSQSGLGAVHGLAHPLGVSLDLAHGLTCAILLPHVLEWNLAVARNELDDLACSVRLPGAEALIKTIRTLCRELGVPASFAEFGLTTAQFDHIVAHCRSGSMRANPRPLSDDDVRELLARLAG